MRPGHFCLALLISAAPPGAAALANDSVAEAAAGGLVLRQTDDIDMVSEDLFVSADEVRVRYVFRNRRPQDVRVTVAFPMPDRNLAELRDQDAAFPSGFATRVDGRPVEMQVERRAMLGDVDHGPLLRELGVPLDAADPLAAAAAALDRLPDEAQRRLIGLGLVEAVEADSGDGMARRLDPLWTVRETWHWEQLFPTGRDLVVEHRYVPGTGSTVGSLLAEPDFRADPEVRDLYARFCVDDAFVAAVDRMNARGGPDRPGIRDEQWVDYILTTGANWRSPIGEFRLVVDKGRPENIVSFCGTGVRRIGPTQFEVRHRNWRPDRNLAVLIIRPNPAE